MAKKPSKSELDALHDLYDGKYGRPRGAPAPTSGSTVDALMRQRPGGPAGPTYSHAAASHHVNDAYVDDLAAAYGVGGGARAGASRSAARAPAPAPASLASYAEGRHSGRAAGAPTGRGGGAAAWSRGPIDPAGTLVELSERPILCLAVDPSGSEVVVGSSDHALYAVDLGRRAKSRTLYGKRAGHTEWVTGACYLGDGSGRVASCGMDGKIVVWGAGARGSSRADSPCAELLGHFGSISAVEAVAGTPLLASCGYDKSVRLWDANASVCVREMRGHGAPVLLQALRPLAGAGGAAAGGGGRSARGSAGPGAGAAAGAGAVLSIATGDRDGEVRVWDAERGSCSSTLSGHRGHVTALAWFTPHPGWGPDPGGVDPSASGAASIPTHADILFSGAQDGHFRGWDLRARSPLVNIELHASAAGAGALGSIAVAHVPTAAPGGSSGGGEGGTETLVVTAGADRTLCVLDPRRGFAPRFRMGEHRDFIYSLHVPGAAAARASGVVLSGAGDGMLLAHDLRTGKPLWGLGANEAAVRCIGTAGGNKLVVTGDDGRVMIYDFPPLAAGGED